MYVIIDSSFAREVEEKEVNIRICNKSGYVFIAMIIGYVYMAMFIGYCHVTFCNRVT